MLAAEYRAQAELIPGNFQLSGHVTELAELPQHYPGPALARPGPHIGGPGPAKSGEGRPGPARGQSMARGKGLPRVEKADPYPYPIDTVDLDTNKM